VNLKIKLAKSFECAPRGRVCVCVFIGGVLVCVCVCVSASVLCFSKKRMKENKKLAFHGLVQLYS
jgi:hypothetical protein